MRPYFEKMADFGKPMTERQIQNSEENVKKIREVEKEIAEAVKKVKEAGIATAEINKRGEMTVYQRLEYLLDPGTWCPLHTLYDPMEEESGTTGVVDGLGKIAGKWAVVIGFDNKVMAGAWIAGQADNILRVTDMAKNLQEHGSFIPGIRPGHRTAEYLERVMTRITLPGAASLALIAVIPGMMTLYPPSLSLLLQDLPEGLRCRLRYFSYAKY